MHWIFFFSVFEKYDMKTEILQRNFDDIFCAINVAFEDTHLPQNMLFEPLVEKFRVSFVPALSTKIRVEIIL